MSVPTLGTVWAIRPDAWAGLRAMLDGGARSIREHLATVDPDRQRALMARARSGRGPIWSSDEDYFDPYEHPHVRESGVAVLPVRGPIMDRAWMCYTGYDRITQVARAFAADARVRAVVMPISSPGGMALGLPDCCGELRQLRAVKPLYTISDLEAGSAAEGLACQGTVSLAHPHGSRGHIGTWIKHIDASAQVAAEGIDVKYYGRGEEKLFFADDIPRTDMVDIVYNRGVDFHYGLLLSAVSLGRSIEIPGLSRSFTGDQARATEARIYHGAEAVAAGLADDVGTLEQLLAILEG